MEELLTQLDKVIEELESKSVVVVLKGRGSEAIELVQVLAEGKTQLERARSALRQSQALLAKGYGKLVGPEEE